jgi:hypothetical protein
LTGPQARVRLKARPPVSAKGIGDQVHPPLVRPRLAPPREAGDLRIRSAAPDPDRDLASHREGKRMAEREPVSAGGVQNPTVQHLSDHGDVSATTMTGPVPVPPLGKPDNPRCPECRLRWRRTLIRYDYGAAFLGYFPADVCPKGHAYLTGESGQAIEAITIASGLWGKAPPRVWPPRKSRLGAQSSRGRALRR